LGKAKILKGREILVKNECLGGERRERYRDVWEWAKPSRTSIIYIKKNIAQ